jgi:hypothetical protein
MLLGDNIRSFIGGHTANCMAIIFGLEHVIILFKWALEYFIQDEPKPVRIARQREEYLLMKQREAIRYQELSTFQTKNEAPRATVSTQAVDTPKITNTTRRRSARNKN